VIAIDRIERVASETVELNDESQADYVEAESHTLGYTSETGARALKSFWEVPVQVTEEPDSFGNGRGGRSGQR